MMITRMMLMTIMTMAKDKIATGDQSERIAEDPNLGSYFRSYLWLLSKEC